jgi:hypothetical protein
MATVLRMLLLSVVVTATVVLGVVFSRAPETKVPDEPTYESVPLSAFDTADVALVRGSFCAAVPDEAVVEAVGGQPQSSTSYDNGERTRLDDGLRDVAHEYGCRWTTPEATARAWLFAPPVTWRTARDVARAAREQAGCEPVGDPPNFGKSSAALVCEVGPRLEVSYRGLFGDAWLTCTLNADPAVPRPELIDRAGRWCVAVIEAARA